MVTQTDKGRWIFGEGHGAVQSSSAMLLQPISRLVVSGSSANSDRQIGAKPVILSLNDAYHDDIYKAILMKLIVTIVDATDADRVMTALTDQHIRFTRVSSTVSFLNPGNSTLLIGVDEKDVAQVMKIIADLATLRTNYIPATYNGTVIPTSFAEVLVGGFQSFVLNVAHFEQV